MSRLEELIQQLCPDGVEYKQLVEVCKLSRGKVYSKDYLQNNPGDYPVYSSQTANNGELGRINTYDCEGDFLTWTTDGAYAGTIFHRKGKFSITNVCGLIKVSNPLLSIRFLYYWLTITAKAYVYQGMGNPKLMTNQIEVIPIPLPPLPIQEEIVRILDTFTERTNNLKGQIQTRRKQYKYYRDQLLDLEGKDGVEMKVSEFCILKAGKSIKADEINDVISENYNYACFGGNGIRGYVGFSSHKGDYPIVGRQGALCGCVCWATGEFYATEHAVVAQGNDDTIQRFLFYLFQNADLNQYKSQGAQPGLSVAKLNEIKFKIPPLVEQQRIVDILDQFEASIANLEAQLKQREKQYEYYRNRLLTFEKI